MTAKSRAPRMITSIRGLLGLRIIAQGQIGQQVLRLGADDADGVLRKRQIDGFAIHFIGEPAIAFEF